MTGGRTFLKDNIFLVAAVCLPLLVVVFFLASTLIPRWRVPPPAYDLVVRADDVYQTNSHLSVTFTVRGGKVEATIRAFPANNSVVRSVLFLFDHTTMTVREVPIDLPDDLVDGDPPRTIVVDALADRQVLADARAPDGYQFESHLQRGGPGLVGEIFGMRRYDYQASLLNKGRVVPIALPASFQSIYSPINSVGWLAPGTAGTPGIPGKSDGPR